MPFRRVASGTKDIALSLAHRHATPYVARPSALRDPYPLMSGSTLAGPCTRRDFVLHAAGLAVTAIGLVPPQKVRSWELFVGTYTKGGTSHGIYRLAVEADTLALSAPQLAVTTADPSFLAFTPRGDTLVAVNELLRFGGEASGSVTAFRRVPGVAALTPTGSTVSSRGAAPCHVVVDARGQHVLVANYVGGTVAVLPLDGTGKLGRASQVLTHTGSGPNRARQQQAHAHCNVFSPDQRFVLSADLGADRIYVRRFDPDTGTLSPARMPEVAMPPGAGPRHLAFAPDGRTVYCANELDSTVSVLAFDATTGALTPQQVIGTRAPGSDGVNAPADIHVHPNGRFLFVSNRGDNTVAVFRIAPTAGTLTPIQFQSCGGDWPRNFVLTPDGRGVLVAHQRSDTIVAFRLDPSTGLLAPTGHAATVPVPVCLVFPPS